MTKILGTANRQIAVDDTVYDIDLIPPNTPIDTDDIDKEIHDALFHKTESEKRQAVKALIANQVREARIKELKLWQSYWKNGKDTRNTDSYVSDRIKELGE